MSKILISPSILSADFGNLAAVTQMINESHADYIHIDIMDGNFVPNISFGFPVTQAIYKHSKKPLDFHLMINNPDNYLDDCKNSGAKIITVHAEVCTHLNRTLNRIKELGVLAGVALNPHTSAEVLRNVVNDLDLVLIMSVNPGFGGQKFIENTYAKIKEIKQIALDADKEIIVEIDGGVNNENAPSLVEAGANMLVAGNYVFNSINPSQAILSLKNP
tara:strand:+ start:318 stop:971 length:654 start_codon:yes stop_codon:yes gene_type:complete